MSNPPFENISEKQSCYNCDDINIINQKVLSQKSIMEEYRHWLKMLLNIVKQNDFEYYPHIKNVSFHYIKLFLFFSFKI